MNYLSTLVPLLILMLATSLYALAQNTHRIVVDKSVPTVNRPYGRTHTSRRFATLGTGLTAPQTPTVTGSMSQPQQSAGLSRQARAVQPETERRAETQEMRRRHQSVSSCFFFGLEPR